MKFTAKTSNTTRLLFNDLGKDVKGVSPQEKFIALDAGDSVYLPDSSGVLYSAMEGDARRYEDQAYVRDDAECSEKAGGAGPDSSTKYVGAVVRAG